MKNLRDKLSGLFWLIVAVFVCLESARAGTGAFHNPGPGFLPFCSAVILGTFAIILIVKSILEREEALNFVDLWKGINWIKVILVIILLLIYAILLPSLGYLIMTFALMVFLFGVLGRPKLWVQIMAAFITSLVTYLIFYAWLQVQLPKGIFGF